MTNGMSYTKCKVKLPEVHDERGVEISSIQPIPTGRLKASSSCGRVKLQE